MAITKVTSGGISDIAAAVEGASDSNKFTDADHTKLNNLAASSNNYVHPNHSGDVVSAADGAMTIQTDAVDIAMLSATGTPSSTTFLRGDNSWQVVAIPKLDAPTITGTLSVVESLTVTHTISNWSDDVSYTITPTNCTVASVNASGQFVITHTSGNPSYTIVATTASLGLDDSITVTKNITLRTVLSAPTLSSPANVGVNTNVVYTITSNDSNDDKLILDLGSSNFTYGSVSHGSGSKVGNTVEVTGFTTNNPVVTLQFTVGATYSVTAKADKIDDSYVESVNSSADSITISAWSAAGGTTSTVGSYTVHTFTSSANFVVTGSKSVDYFMIAGGGGGAGWSGGGGGAGGYISNTLTATSQTYSIVIGSGGSGGVGNNNGSQGANTTGLGQTAVGGGYGGMQAGGNGGSGGGGGQANYAGGSATSGQGYAGGQGSPAAHPWGHGGGGGASEVGTGGHINTARSGEGGAGIQNNLDGNNYYYGGGGGGGGHNGTATGWSFGGIGGGGAGSSYETGATGGGSARNSGGSVSANANGGNGGANTGGGAGGGAGGNNNGGVGGSGIMIIRYLT